MRVACHRFAVRADRTIFPERVDMWIEIGKKRTHDDVVDLLLDCHGRIRAFSRLAERIADARGTPEAEIAEAAARVRRYFSVALPLHVADEEESILPRLSGKDAAVDAALRRMEEEHDGHVEPLRRLVEICAALAERPADLDAHRARLGQVAGALVRAFDAHLAAEEETVFPAIRTLLDSEERAAIFREVRARRRAQD